MDVKQMLTEKEVSASYADIVIPGMKGDEREDSSCR